ncbi:hypothetical protein V6N11_013066 [Hibiscus sabdariffa]
MLALYVLKLVLAVWLEDLVPMRPEMVILSQDLAASRLHPTYHLHQGDFLGEVRHMILVEGTEVEEEGMMLWLIPLVEGPFKGYRGRVVDIKVDRNFVSDNVVVSTPNRDTSRYGMGIIRKKEILSLGELVHSIRAYEAPTPSSGWASTPGSSYSEAGTPRDSGSQT